MTHAASNRVDDRVLIACVMAAAFAEMAIRELFHRAGSETGSAIMLALVWLSIGVASRCSTRWLPAAASRWRIPRIFTILGLLAAANTIFNLLRLLRSDELSVASTVAGVCVVLALLALAMPYASWCRVRPMVAVFALLFVLSQPVIAGFRSTEKSWPDPAGSESGADAARPVATLVLLLDELNAREAPKFERALKARGLAVASKAVRPIDGNTHQVVPGMFSGRRFHDAKACSPSAVCAGADVLDYAKISASRNDIDVVGFFQPYCAIRGLRYCKRIAFDADVFQFDRWRCAFWRRTGMTLGVEPNECAAVFNVSYESLRTTIQSSIFEAPVFSKGGVLFAHIPLPHPPGRAVEASLGEHYRDNIERAVALVDSMATKLEHGGIAARVLIFSDHPLRATNWCTKHIPYVEHGCVVTPDLTDSSVPLIVAASAGAGKLPNISAVQDNGSVFSFIADWQRVN